MQITSRFTIAIHILLCIASFEDKRKVTSNFIALSTNSNPVIIRRILGQLKEAELIEIKSGVGGSRIAKPLNTINLLDIFKAVEAVSDNIFSFHANPNCKCPIGRNIHTVLDERLYSIQEAMNNKMKEITLDTLLEETEEFLQQE